MKHCIRVLHQGEWLDAHAEAEGESLFDVLVREKLMYADTCGGHGYCGKCAVRVIEGDAGEATEQEKRLLTKQVRGSGVRLACLVAVNGAMRIETLGHGQTAAILTEGAMPDVPLRPAWLTQYDAARDVSLITDGNETIMRKGRARLLALAVDIGTTTVVAYLLDLASGETLDAQSAVNAQAAYGADVISRAQMTMERPEGLYTLSALIRAQIQALAERACKTAGAEPMDIVQVGIAGNPVMTHLFAMLPVNTIAVAPYTPKYTKGFIMDMRDAALGLNPAGKVHLLPCISGYVGADTVAAAIACALDERDTLSLMLDIGTNGEMMLGTKDRLIACATAAGPAFEGGHILFGMGGVSGAIERVWTEDGALYTSVIGNAPAQGICGSGLVDAVAVLLKAGCLDETGVLDASEATDAAVASRVKEIDGETVFLLRSADENATRDIYLTQKDVREVQLAKGAVAAGIRILLNSWGAQITDVTRVFLAGGFGTYIDYDSACVIGLIPKALRGRIVPVGNAAGSGVRMALRDKECLARAERVREQTDYLELAEVREFQDIFMDEMMFL